MITPRILVLGTLDTKGEEFALLRDELRSLACEPIVADLGIMGTPLFEGDIPREVVLQKGGYSLEDLQSGRRRGEAMEAAIAGGIAVAKELVNTSRIDGVIAMGGGSGTTIGTTIMQELPLGIPKLVVTTLSTLHPWVKGTDVVVLRTLVDLVGLNAITRLHIQQAAGAIAGMSRRAATGAEVTKSVLITCLGVTTPGVMQLRELLLARGMDVLVLHRRTHNVPLLVNGGFVEAIVDFTPNELTDSVVHPRQSDPDDRLRIARLAGIPMVVSAGALDMHIHFGPVQAVPSEMLGRKQVVHSRDALLINTSADEQARLGSVLGKQLAGSVGPVAAVVPMGGFSMWDAAGREFDDPASREAFATALEAEAPVGSVTRVDAHINSQQYAAVVCQTLMHLLDR